MSGIAAQSFGMAEGPPATVRGNAAAVLAGMDGHDTVLRCSPPRELRKATPQAPNAAPDRYPLDALAAPGLQDVTSPHGNHAGLLAGGRDPLVWVQDAVSRLELGAPHARGASACGLDPTRLIVVRAARAVDALWAMEEALVAGLPVIGEIEGAPRALDFTATRRLEMRAQASEVRCVLARIGPRAATGGSSGARWRWRVLPHPSEPDPFDPAAPGAPCWRLELTRARDRPPGSWVVAHDRDSERGEGGEAHRLRVVAALADGDVDPRPGARERGGTVVSLRPGRVA